MTLRYHK